MRQESDRLPNHRRNDLPGVAKFLKRKMPESRGDKIDRNEEEMPRRETESRSFEREKETRGWRRDHSKDSNCHPLTSRGVLFISPRSTCPLAGRPPLFELPD